MDTEIYNQQKYVVGMFGGIVEDVKYADYFQFRFHNIHRL